MVKHLFGWCNAKVRMRTILGPLFFFSSISMIYHMGFHQMLTIVI